MRISCLVGDSAEYRIGRRHAGFTLIEIMIVIAINGIISAIAIPDLIEARKVSNEEGAIGAMRTLATAQSIFREGDIDKNGILDYAQTLAVLGKFKLIDSQLATGRKHGYAFYLATTPDRMHWSAVAEPAATDRSGARHFFVDDTGAIRLMPCPPGKIYNPDTKRCLPVDTLLETIGITAIERLNSMSGGVALGLAKERLQSEAFVQTILKRLDANGDGQLTFTEALNANLHEVLRNILHDIGEHGSVGDVAALAEVYRAYSRGVRTDIALGIANENALPAVQITALHGNVIAFLNQIGQSITHQ